jgi:hypothetical protein
LIFDVHRSHPCPFRHASYSARNAALASSSDGACP